jgi:ferritin-like metal-binding protein YciE
VLEEDEVAELLSENLDQEKEFDERLTEIAESTANIEAAEDEAAEMEEEEGEEQEDEKPSR